MFSCSQKNCSPLQPVETDDELAKGEALVEALTTFCNVVRKTPRSSPEDQELLNSAGKLGMEHIIPIYRVGVPLSTRLPCIDAEAHCNAVCKAASTAVHTRCPAAIWRAICSCIPLAGVWQTQMQIIPVCTWIARGQALRSAMA